jgi:hypothetical protein
MSVFPGSEQPIAEDEVARRTAPPEAASLFARIEGLIGEETALLAIPAEERSREHHDRLRGIAHELDRIWESLHRRAAAHPGGSGQPA